MVRTRRKKDDQTGSLFHSEPEFLVIGKLLKPYGLLGGMILKIMTDFPERIYKGKKVYIGNEKWEHSIKDVLQKGKSIIVLFEGYDQPEQLSGLINQLMYIPTRQLPSLPVGEYYHHQLIGLKVLDLNKNFLGILNEILSTGANDVYVIKDPDNPANELLLPALKSVILKVNLADHTMIVTPPQWL